MLRLLLLCCWQAQIKKEVKPRRVTSQVQPHWFLILYKFLFFNFTAPEIISSDYSKPGDFLSGSLSIRFEPVSQVLASLAAYSYMTGSCFGGGGLTVCTNQTALGRWESRDLWVHRAVRGRLIERHLFPPPGGLKKGAIRSEGGGD